MRMTNTKTFIEMSKQRIGDIYDYSKVVYTRGTDKVVIGCKKHGDFLVSPDNHVHKKSGCPKCKHEATANRCRKNVNTFKLEATIVHSGLYTYDKVMYNTARKPVIITCPTHGDFEQTPDNHLKGVGCPSCNGGIYNANKETVLYYLSINNGQAYKIGITCKTLKTRFNINDFKKLEKIKTWVFTNGRLAYEVEQALLKHFKKYKYTGDDLLLTGNTELLIRNVLDTYANVFSSIKDYMTKKEINTFISSLKDL